MMTAARVVACACLMVLWVGRARAQTGNTISFGPAQQVDHPPPVPVFYGSVGTPQMAFDGTNYLVVWSGSSSIAAARVTPAGTVLDSPAFDVSATSSIQRTFPVVAFDGDNYLVAWAENNQQVWGRRVSPAGEALDAPFPISLRTTLVLGSAPTVVFDGTSFLVAWTDSAPAGTSIWGAHVTSSETVVEPDTLVLTSTAQSPVGPQAASNGSGALVLWREAGAVAGAHVGAGGALDRIVVAPNTASDTLRIVADGTGYQAVWSVLAAASSTVTLATAHIDGSGQVGAAIALGSPQGFVVGLALGFDGQRFLIVWQGDPTVAVRLDRSGALLDPPAGVVVTNALQGDDVLGPVPGGGFWAIAFGDIVPLDACSPSGSPVVVGSPFPFAFRTDSESIARAGLNGAGYIVAWQNAVPALRAARVSVSGQVLDQTPVTVATGNLGDDLRISSNGDASLVTWYTFSGDSAQLVSSTLQLVGSAINQPVLTESPSMPGSSFDGTKFVVMTVQDFNGAGTHPVVGDFGVDLSGNAVGGLIHPSPLVSLGPEVGCMAARCLVALMTSSNLMATSVLQVDSLAVMFTGEPSAGQLPGAFVLAPRTPLVRITSDGNNWLMVWSAAPPDLHAARIDPTGHVLDVPPLSIAPGQNATALATTFDGQNYLVAWTNGSGHILLARVSPAGVVLDPGGVVGPQGDDPSVAGDLLAYIAPAEGFTRAFFQIVSVAATDADGGVDAGMGGAGGGVDAGMGGAGGGIDAGMGGAGGGVHLGMGCAAGVVDAATDLHPGVGGAGGGVDAGAGGADGAVDAGVGGVGGADVGAGGAGGAVDAATDLHPTGAGGSAAADAGVHPGHSGGCACAYSGADSGDASFGWIWLAVAAFVASRRRRSAPRAMVV